MFHKNLKRAMINRGMSQKQLSTMTGISNSGISQYINGLVTPRKDALDKLVATLNVPAELLVYGQCPELKVSPEGLQRIKKLTPGHIAKISGTGAQSIRIALQQGKSDYGYAIKLTSDRYAYHFYPKKVEECYGSLTGYGYFLEGYHNEPEKAEAA
jgi:transcriptional regulator with XRE-family HTH domain